MTSKRDLEAQIGNLSASVDLLIDHVRAIEAGRPGVTEPSEPRPLRPLRRRGEWYLPDEFLPRQPTTPNPGVPERQPT